MTIANRLHTIRATMNRGVADVLAQLSTFFAANPKIVVQYVDFNWLDTNARADDLIIRIAYQLVSGTDSLGVTYSAQLYTSGTTQQAVDAFNAVYAAGSALTPLFVLDLTDHETRQTAYQSLIVISATTLVGLDRTVLVGAPVAPIAAGASGSCTLLFADGSSAGTGVVKNMHASTTWVDGERNYVVFDETTGLYLGLPSCSGAAALTTTTPAITTTNQCITLEFPSVTPSPLPPFVPTTPPITWSTAP